MVSLLISYFLSYYGQMLITTLKENISKEHAIHLKATMPQTWEYPSIPKNIVTFSRRRHFVQDFVLLAEECGYIHCY